MSSDEPQPGSITRWISDLKDGDDAAIEHIWARYFEQLASVASRQLRNRTPVADGDDVALSVFAAIARGAQDGKFPLLTDRDDLWNLFLSIIQHKVASHVRHELAQKRGSGKIPNMSSSLDRDDILTLHGLESREPTPDEVAILHEEIDRLFGNLNSPQLQTVAQEKLQGVSNANIARHLNVSVRTVERKLNVIYAKWKALSQ